MGRLRKRTKAEDAVTGGLPDLHRHLDGSLRLSTLYELAHQAGATLPDDPAAIRFYAGMGLIEALQRFGWTLSALQSTDAVTRVAAEICEDAAAEEVTTLEIRFAPQLHLGASVEAVVDAAIEGVDGRAGLILCGLYGEDPEVLGRLVDVAHGRPEVVGIDLAGGPAADHAFSMTDYAPAFSRARDLGLGRTVHAGEGRPPEEIATAITALHAQRIGHGTTLLDDPAVLALVLDRGVLIEACPTSNVHTGVISTVSAHPMVSWLELGVRVCINSDNTLLSDTDASTEHRLAADIPGMTEALLQRAIAFGHGGAFERDPSRPGDA
ncbi:MAG: adenosine deaminase family protein [Myxococcota bacterium]|jgi:adenosine deaminase|nr:adenosine deaminase family protein [Myxococcota bacterium]